MVGFAKDTSIGHEIGQGGIQLSEKKKEERQRHFKCLARGWPVEF